MNDDLVTRSLVAQILYLNDIELMEYVRLKLNQRCVLWSEKYADRQNWLSNLLCRVISVGIPDRVKPRLTAVRIVMATRSRCPGIMVSKEIKQLVVDVVFTVDHRKVREG